MTRDHWKNDRDDDMVLDFADDGMVIEGTKMWLGLDDSIQCNNENVQKAFEALNDDTQIEILENYIEEVGMEPEFDAWYEVKFDDEADGDWINEDDIDFPVYGTAGRCEL